MKRMLMALILAGLLGAPYAPAAIIIQGDEVNISGATLFTDFFRSPNSTNDWIDVDHDGIWGFDPATWQLDQLAPTFACNWSGWWLVQFRGVGSGNGLSELVDYHLLGTIPTSIPAEVGLINRVQFALGGSIQGTGCPVAWPSGSPYAPTRVDMAVLDVPARWFVRQPGTPQWNRKPGEAGYGLNPINSWDTGYSQKLRSLERTVGGQTVSMNINVDNPDRNTLFDTQIAWVPIAMIVNRGTGIANIKVSELQYLYVTGRMPNGMNLVAATRDPGSGTRNGAMNSFGIDPSFGRGDNLGTKYELAEKTLLGPNYQPTNCGGSGIMENIVQRTRLAVGYTGLMGASRAAADVQAGRYEMLNIMYDDRGGTAYVRPSLDNVLDTCDPDDAWQIGGPETFTTRGNPAITGDPAYPSNIWVNPPAGADYINNITQSINDFVDPNAPIDPESLFNMPGEYLATTFVLLAGVDCLPNLSNPTIFEPNPALNQDLQEYMRTYNYLIVNPYGHYNVAGKTPNRSPNPCWEWDTTDPQNPICITPPEQRAYSDGSADGRYYNYFTDNPNNPYGASIVGDSTLNARNALAGDFNGDGVRDIQDIPAMMDAIYDPAAYATNNAYNTTVGNPVAPEIIGDFNGDGNFDASDVRYFADGLALNAQGVLDRAAAFIAVDLAWETLTGDNNFFGTITPTGCYRPGDSRFDVAGGTPTPGAAPLGADGVIDGVDRAYLAGKYGDWTDLAQAANLDLSCDLNGDYVVDAADLALMDGALGAYFLGDIDGNCCVELSDLAALLGAYGKCPGDSGYDPRANLTDDGDPCIRLSDLAALLGNYGHCE